MSTSTKRQRDNERLAATRTFLEELARLMPEDQRLIVGFAERANVTKDEADTHNSSWWPEPYGIRTTLYSTRNDYVSIASAVKTENHKTGKMRYWRGTANFGTGLAFYVDDIGDGQGSKGGFALSELEDILPPTVVIETSPGNYQAWYFFSEPVTNARYFKDFLTSFTHTVLAERGGDTTINDIMRVGRLPYGINNKVLDDGSLKYEVDGDAWEVTQLYADYTRRYTTEQIVDAFGFTVQSFTRPPVERDDEELLFDRTCLMMATVILSRYKMGESADGSVIANQSGRYRIRCPWGDNHTNGDPRGAYFRGPVPGEDADYVFGCSHHSCKGHKRWNEFVDEVVMPVIYNVLSKANRNDSFAELMFNKGEK